jgi:hypothetical protein
MAKGTSNSWAQLDVRLQVDREDVQNMLGTYIDAKQEAIRTVFKQVGNLYKKELRSLMGNNFGQFESSFFKFKTVTEKGGNITLLAGLIDQKNFSQTSNYLRFWLYGTKAHWVSLKAHQDVADWAERVGIIEQGADGAYYFTSDGKRAWAVMVSNQSHVMDVRAIQQELIKELMRRLQML